MSTRIQQKLWKLANYDCFLMEYCPVLHNKIAAIGIFILFQILIVFVSVFTYYKVLVSSYLMFGVLIAASTTFAFYKAMKFINEIYHTNHKMRIFVFHSLFNLIFAFLLAVPFWLTLFEYQILFQLFLNTGKITFGNIELLWLMPKAFYETCFINNEGKIMGVISFSIFLIIAYIFITPYFFILKSKKSNYNTLKINYEKKFHYKT